jgi:hypothetical protein
MKHSILILSVFLLSFLSTPVLGVTVSELLEEDGVATPVGILYIDSSDPLQNQFVNFSALILNPQGEFDISINISSSDPVLFAGDEGGDNYVRADWLYFSALEETVAVTITQDGETVFSQDVLVRPLASQQVTESVILESVATPQDIDDYTFTDEDIIVGQDVLVTKDIVYVQVGDSIYTTYTINLDDAGYTDVRIVEFIPKEVASDVSDIYFSIQPTTVLDADPVVMWHLDDLDDAQVSYSVPGEQDVTGNTVIVAKQEEKTSVWRILAPLLVIPIVGALIIFFSQFSPEEKKKK